MFLKSSGGDCSVASLVASSNSKNEDGAKPDSFCDLFSFLKGGGANAALFLRKLCQLQIRLGTYGLTNENSSVNALFSSAFIL